MDADDAMIVVILEDEDEPNSTDEKSSFPANIKIKEEVLDDEIEDAFLVEKLLETAEKHGEHLDLDNLDFINVKVEPCDYDIEAISDEEYVPDDIYSDEYDDDMEDDYVEDDDDEDYNARSRKYKSKKKKKSTHKKKSQSEYKDIHRTKMLDPSECVSYVAEIRKMNPEFNTNQVVAHVAALMKSIKPPPPPEEFYEMVHDKYQCTLCSISSTTLPAATRHYQEKHGPRYLCCYACGVDFRSMTNLYKHEKRCTSDDAMLVLKARALAIGRKGRHRPFLNIKIPGYSLKKPAPPKEEKKFKCEECSAVFKNMMSLKGHIHLHRGERPYPCHECGAAYTTPSAYYRHRQKHANKKFICDHCNREFNTKSAIISHMDTHLALRKHLCPYEGCGRRFAQKMGLNVHINNRHQLLPPPFGCQLCPRRFNRMSLLKGHTKKEHGMDLITRNMFFKSLPTLSELELRQAKLFFDQDEPHKLFDVSELVSSINSKYKPKQNSSKREIVITADGKVKTKQKRSKPKIVITADDQQSDDTYEMRDLPVKVVKEEVDKQEMLHIEVPAYLENENNDSEIMQYVQNVIDARNSQGLDTENGIIVIEDGQVKYINNSSEMREEYEKIIDYANKQTQEMEGISMPEL